MHVDKRMIAKLLASKISYFSEDELLNLIEIPPSEIEYDYAFPCFRLAKFEKKNPNLIAANLKNDFKIPDYLTKIDSVGAYLNFKINPVYILESVFESNNNYGKILKDSSDSEEIPLKIVLEFPSPNTNKPLHFGHIRNMLISKSLSNSKYCISP